jgi:phage terminase small subunit
MAKGLTKRQEIFISEYLKDGNGVRSAIAAGCKEKHAGVQACKWLKIPKIKSVIETKHIQRIAKIDFSAEKVLEGLAKLAFFDIRKLYNEDGSLKPITELDDQTAGAICGIEVEEAYQHFGAGQAKPTGILKKIKIADRGINLERLGRYHKLFTDKVEVSGLDGLADAIQKARSRVK